MNPVPDAIPAVETEALDIDKGSFVITNCGYNEDGEWHCETTTNEVTSNLIIADEAETNQDLFFDFESLLSTLYDTLSIFSNYNPSNYITYQDNVVYNEQDPDFVYELVPAEYDEDFDLIVEFDEDDLTDIIDFEIYGDDDTEIVDTNFFDMGFGNTYGDDVIFYFDNGENYYPTDDIPCHHMNMQDGFVPEPEWEDNVTIAWQDQIFTAFAFVLLALIVAKIVLLCKRIPSRTRSANRAPLLTVTVENPSRQESGSYIPPTPGFLKKAVNVGKTEKEPHIVFI